MSPTEPVRGAPRRRWLATLGIAMAFSLAACTVAPEPTGPTMTAPTPAATPGDPTSPAATPESASGTTAIHVVVGEVVLQATLWDNAAGRSLLDQLPLTLPIRDHGQQEKISTPPHPLSMDAMPAGDDPEPLDIGYYAPDRVLVFYYADVGYFNGIARLGHFDTPIDTLVDLADGTTVTIELAK